MARPRMWPTSAAMRSRRSTSLPIRPERRSQLGSKPFWIAVTPDGKTAYVTDSGTEHGHADQHRDQHRRDRDHGRRQPRWGSRSPRTARPPTSPTAARGTVTPINARDEHRRHRDHGRRTPLTESRSPLTARPPTSPTDGSDTVTPIDSRDEHRRGPRSPSAQFPVAACDHARRQDRVRRQQRQRHGHADQHGDEHHRDRDHGRVNALRDRDHARPGANRCVLDRGRQRPARRRPSTAPPRRALSGRSPATGGTSATARARLRPLRQPR